MTDSTWQTRNKLQRTPKGFFDRKSKELTSMNCALNTIHALWSLRGFESFDTPIIEYADALGKFLPDQDRPNDGVFALQDDDGQWLALRYDLTAPMARFLAQHWNTIPKPYRIRRSGWVFRNEKPDPCRFRQFMQCDADIVGVDTVIADAELCILMVDTLEALGFNSTDYVIRINNRKILDSVLAPIEEQIHDENEKSYLRLKIMRAVDKLGRLGVYGVRQLLGGGRMDESGDFTEGAGLGDDDITRILSIIEISLEGNSTQTTMEALKNTVRDSTSAREGINELQQICDIVSAMGYADNLTIDPSIVRGLEYYTGPVYEAALLHKDISGKPRFDSICGGGRYDGLITRASTNIPGGASGAAGFSIGLSRLLTIMDSIDLPLPTLKTPLGPVIITVIDPLHPIRYQKLSATLRKAGIMNEVYLGNANLKVQLKYADRRNAPCVIIQGAAEMELGVVQIKNLILGKQLSQKIFSNKTWRENNPAQISVPEDKVVPTIKELLNSLESCGEMAQTL